MQVGQHDIHVAEYLTRHLPSALLHQLEEGSFLFPQHQLRKMEAMNAKYQIFVSSTYEDLKEERDQVIKAILEMGHIPVGMEMFSAADEEQWKIIARQIDASDYYVVVVAHRYGSITDEDISYTEKEYDYAVSQQVPTLGFVIDGNADWQGNRMDRDPQKIEALDRFKAKVQSKPVGFWRDKLELYAKVAIALMKAFVTHPRPGWVRATQAMSPETGEELSRLSRENAELREQLTRMPANTQTFMPDFELHFWISWDKWESGGGFGVEKWENGYRLHIELENVGNASADLVEAIIQIPEGVLTDTDQREVKVGNAKRYINSSGVSSKIHIFLPGKKETAEHELTTEAVETPGDKILRFTIHPDIGYAKSGEIPLSEIKVRSRRPSDD